MICILYVIVELLRVICIPLVSRDIFHLGGAWENDEKYPYSLGEYI
jgi:hypothetical protein